MQCRDWKTLQKRKVRGAIAELGLWCLNNQMSTLSKSFIAILTCMLALQPCVSGALTNVGVVLGGEPYGTDFTHADYWSGNPGAQYLATFSVNNQIDALWTFEMPNYAGSGTGFGSAAGVIYSENRSALLEYIPPNNYALNGFFYAAVYDEEGAGIWSRRSGQIRDVLLGETLNIYIERLRLWSEPFGYLTYLGAAPTLDLGSSSIVPVSDSEEFNTSFDTTDYINYKAIVTAEAEGDLIVSFNTGEFILEDPFGGNSLSLGQPVDNTLLLKVVPEPSAVSLLAIGLGGLAMMLRRRRS